MKKLFLFLVRRYSKTESDRMEIYKELWDKVNEEYSEQTLFGNVYNMNIEILMSNPFFVSRVMTSQDEDLRMLKSGLSDSFDTSVDFVESDLKK